MLRKTLTYKDFNDQVRTEDFYFNLTKAEIIELEYSEEGGISDMLKRIVAEQDTKKIVEIFKVILLKAYGEKSTDGRRFIKSDEISTAFSQTTAYSDLFMELATNSDLASAFMQAIIPQDIVDEIKKSMDMVLPG